MLLSLGFVHSANNGSDHGAIKWKTFHEAQGVQNLSWSWNQLGLIWFWVYLCKKLWGALYSSCDRNTTKMFTEKFSITFFSIATFFFFLFNSGQKYLGSSAWRSMQDLPLLLEICQRWSKMLPVIGKKNYLKLYWNKQKKLNNLLQTDENIDNIVVRWTGKYLPGDLWHLGRKSLT